MLPLLALAALRQDIKPNDPLQKQERTVFQTGKPYSDRINLRGDVAIVYGIDKDMPARVKSWRDRGYRIHLMTGVAWGEYQDYVYGRWDGKNHEDEAQTRANGEKIGHGRDVWYMSPGPDYGKYLAEGVRKAMDVGVEAVHLEEPEFWSWGGHAPAFKREWQTMYGEPWQAPESSPDARWRAGKLMYFLYRRALQQVFDSVQAYNKQKGTKVRCYVPTHSLLNYADWGIVSPQSSLAQLNGCDGYIAQVWTGTAREPNFYKNVKKERTFETAFLEYGIMQNLVRSTGRSVWYLADPIEDNPNHDWGDYRDNYHATLVASLLQPDVAQYEIAPWPERIFNDKYPSQQNPTQRIGIPGEYAQELQIVFNALKDMKQQDVEWMSGTRGVGIVMSDSLMFQRGGPNASDDDFGHIHGMALPFVKRGIPLQPMQLENVGLKSYLDDVRVLLMSYEGQKPLSPDVHAPVAKWVRDGGTLVFVDDDADPFNKVREWWNTGGNAYATPREHLFEQMGLLKNTAEGTYTVGKGRLIYLSRRPSLIAKDAFGASLFYDYVAREAKGIDWQTQGSIALRRGPYIVSAGMDETEARRRSFTGRFVDLFDPALKLQKEVRVRADSRNFLVDLNRFQRDVIACAGQVLNESKGKDRWSCTVEGISDTPGVLLVRMPKAPKKVTLDGQPLSDQTYDEQEKLLWLRFPNQPRPRRIEVEY
ncbi:hypothetical protein EON82_08730 [bacterium]|nr:MAG: hypothetical protein EON82_08730 [bacterium]